MDGRKKFFEKIEAIRNNEKTFPILLVPCDGRITLAVFALSRGDILNAIPEVFRFLRSLIFSA